MNPLTSVRGTIISGFVLAIIVAWYVSPENSSLVQRNLSVWLHALFGVTWIGLLYYFNFVQVPAMADALADEGGPGPAAIGKYVAPRALLWFRMAAAATLLLFVPNLVIFMVMQSNVMDTMSHSGIK